LQRLLFFPLIYDFVTGAAFWAAAAASTAPVVTLAADLAYKFLRFDCQLEHLWHFGLVIDRFISQLYF
jgi:hypothetical protein